MTFLSPNVIIASPSQQNCSALPPLSVLSLDIPTTPDNGSAINMIGTDYVVLDKIGQGSFAQVHVARHVADISPKYAVKIIKKPEQPITSSLTSSKFVANPDTEVFCLKRAQGHPNIVRLHCVSSSANHLFLVQDYLQGGDMFDEIVRVWRARGGTVHHGGLDESVAVKYFLNLLSAVEHLHLLGIAHRDIKTENMFIAKDRSCIQLGDFGFASCSSKCFTRCGTLDYVAPEVLLSTKETGGFDPKRADIWSCMVVLYAMLTARLPFDANTKLEIMHRIKTRKVLKVPEGVLSPEAHGFLMTVLLAAPEARPTIPELRNHPFICKYLRQFAVASTNCWSPSAPELPLSPSVLANGSA